MNYDYLVVGAGLFGCVFSHEVTKKGKKCLVVDRRSHIGGNTYCKKEEGINIHQYGAHIFHTNSKKIWEYVNSFVEFNRYTHTALANYKGQLYNLPFNMNTFHKIWGVNTPAEAISRLEKEKRIYATNNPQNLEEKAISMVGFEIFDKLIRGYSEKQWGRKAKDLPASIIKRLPVRFTYDNSYFSDKYQGIPIGGYNILTKKLLTGIEVRLNVDFFENRYELENLARKIVFTGKIDEYFDCCFGELEYRSLRFEHELINTPNFQGCSVMNFTDHSTPYTRIIEHKFFEFGKQRKTIITREYPLPYIKGREPYYPINDAKNRDLYNKYHNLSVLQNNKVVFGGRLAEYKYYDMHQVIGSAINLAKKELA